MSTPADKITTNDPKFMLVTMDGLREALRVVHDKARGGDLVAVPSTYTATALTSGTGDIMLQTDEPPDDSGIQPTMYAQTVIGPVRSGTRVQVMHEGAGNLIIGKVPDEDQWASPGDPDEWVANLQTTDGTPIPVNGHGFWYQSGPTLDLQGIIQISAVPTGTGNVQFALGNGYAHPGSNAVTTLSCGAGYAQHGDGTQRGFLAIYSNDVNYIQMTADGQSSAGFRAFTKTFPWTWGVGDLIMFHVRAILARPS